MKKTKLLLFAAVLFFVPASLPAAGECEITEESRIIRTYPFSDPDPVPILVRKPCLYPYFSFNGYSREGRDAAWTVIVMENDHVRIEVLPGAGGKIYGAIEKSTGNEFVYRNDAMKFRQIALRGPWCSGGIEFNFGFVGHAPSTATPVDYVTRKNDDGSVSCVVGAIDLPSRTRWSVTVTVPKDGAFFETRTLWFNPSPFHQSYYSWMNSAVRAADDLHYFYPGRFSLSHSRTRAPAPWPVDRKGRDLSRYGQNAFGADKSYFIYGEYENFFGGYWHDSRFGFGHYALYDDMPGKKMWIWALSRQGAIWERLLTDGHGQYSEPQAGRLLSQSDHEFFSPCRGDTWKEIFFPFKEIGGLKKASPFCAMNSERNGNSLCLGLCALQALDDDLVVTQDGEEVLRERLVLKPMEVRSLEIALPRSGGNLVVAMGEKLRWTDDPGANDIGRPQGYQLLDESTPEGLYLSGEFHEKQRGFETAMVKYGECLSSEPNHVRAMTRLAELHCRRAEYTKGLEYAQRALTLLPYDPDANYVYGVISRFLDNLVDAKETYGWAARSMKHRSSAYCRMAEICVLEGRLDLALEYAGRAIDFNRYNLRALEVKAVICRASGRMSLAGKVLDELLELDPLNHLARFERYLLERSGENLALFQAMIRGELPHEAYLETAVFYSGLRRHAETAELLGLAPANPTVLFWLAHVLRERDGERSGRLLREACRLSPRLVFPHREETIPVLKWAAARCPEEWKPRYYLGLVLLGKGRKSEALRLFASCGEADFAPLHSILGFLDRKEARRHFERALSADMDEWRAWHDLVKHLGREKQFDKALDLARRAAARFSGSMVLAMDLAGALFDSGRYAKCLEILGKLEILPYEGSWEAHSLYLRSHVFLALEAMRSGDFETALGHLERSREYPESLGTGKPFDPDCRLHDFLAALCCEKMGDAAAGERFRKRVLEYTEKHRAGWGWDHYFGLLALRDSGEEGRAAALLEELERAAPGDFRNRWRRARFQGEIGKAAAIEKEHGDDARLSLEAKAAALAESMK